MRRRLVGVVLVLGCLAALHGASGAAGAAAEAPGGPRAAGPAGGPYAFVAGRRDAKVTVVDVGRGLDPVNDGTPNAIIGEAKTAADVGSEPRGDRRTSP